MTLTYDVTVTGRAKHSGEWLEHYGSDGALDFTCGVGDSPAGVLFSAGWGNVDHCPVCGSEVTIETEEV